MHLITASAANDCRREVACDIPHCISHLLIGSKNGNNFINKSDKKKKKTEANRLISKTEKMICLKTNRIRHESSIRIFNNRWKSAIIIQEHNYLLPFRRADDFFESVQSWWISRLLTKSSSITKIQRSYYQKKEKLWIENSQSKQCRPHQPVLRQTRLALETKFS